MKRNWNSLLAGVTAASILECGQALPPPVPTDVAVAGATREKETTVVDSSTPLDPATDPALQGFVTLAKGDLAKRLGVEPDQIELVEMQAVVWPDASLGCPLPGMRYKQVPGDGLLIRLRSGTREYRYHSGGTRGPFLCQHGGGAPATKSSGPGGLPPPPGSADD